MSELTAKDIMTREVLTVQQDMALTILCNFLVENQISGAPVLNSDGKLSGVVSVKDLTRFSGECAVPKETPPSQDYNDYYLHGWEYNFDLHAYQEQKDLYFDLQDGKQVKDIMTPVVYEVEEDATLTDMAVLMTERRIHRLPVTRDGELIGIVTTLDMLKTMTPGFDKGE